MAMHVTMHGGVGCVGGDEGDGLMLTVLDERARPEKESIECGTEWLSLHEDRVYDMLKTLGVCG